MVYALSRSSKEEGRRGTLLLNLPSHVRLVEVSRHQMKTLSLPLVSACCYNICLLLASTVIRQHKGLKSDDVLPACVRCACVPWRTSAREMAVTIIMHKTVGEALPCQNIFIAVPLPAPVPLPPALYVDRGVSATFVTLSYGYYPLVYLASSMLERGPRRESRTSSLSLTFFLSLRRLQSFSRSDSSLMHVHAYTSATSCMRAQGRIFISVS